MQKKRKRAESPTHRRKEKLRRVLGRDGKTAYDRAKTRLPAFCVSGTTADRKRLLKHTGLLQLDFDGLNGTLAATLQNFACVARNVPRSVRHELLSFEHHRALARLDEHRQKEWIATRLEENGAGRRMSVRRLRRSTEAEIGPKALRKRAISTFSTSPFCAGVFRVNGREVSVYKVLERTNVRAEGEDGRAKSGRFEKRILILFE